MLRTFYQSPRLARRLSPIAPAPAAPLKLALAAAALVAACGGPSGVAGAWQLDQAAVQGVELPPMVETMSMTAVFADDGTVEIRTELSMMGSMQVTASQGTWVLDGSVLTVTPTDEEGTPTGDPMAASFEDGRISWEDEGITVVMVRK